MICLVFVEHPESEIIIIIIKPRFSAPIIISPYTSVSLLLSVFGYQL